MASQYDEPAVYLHRTADFQMMIDGLAALEDVATQVAAPRKRGRPSNTAVMTTPIINELCRVYASSTGLKPGASDGPFGRFVVAFAKAVNRGVFDDDSIVAAIKRARRKTLQRSYSWQNPSCWGR
jgi:hypothetical protein